MQITIPVRHVTIATPRTRLISLDLAGQAFAFVAGQAVMVGLHHSPIRKPYSIASAPWEVQNTGLLQLLAQIDDTGSPDPHLELAAPGTLMDVDGPFGTFGVPAESNDAPLMFVAGGTGIAPLRSMLMERLARPSAPRISVIYSVRTPDEFAYRMELEALATAGRIALHLTVTRPDDVWQGRRGRIDAIALKQALPEGDPLVLVCGPPPLIVSVTEWLVELGVDPDRILIEKF